MIKKKLRDPNSKWGRGVLPRFNYFSSNHKPKRETTGPEGRILHCTNSSGENFIFISHPRLASWALIRKKTFVFFYEVRIPRRFRNDRLGFREMLEFSFLFERKEKKSFLLSNKGRGKMKIWNNFRVAVGKFSSNSLEINLTPNLERLNRVAGSTP